MGNIVGKTESCTFDMAVLRRLVIEERDVSDGDDKRMWRRVSAEMDDVVRALQEVLGDIGGDGFDGQYDVMFGDDSTRLDARDVNDLAWAWVDFCYDNSIDPFSVDRIERVGDYECDVPPEDGV